MHKMSVLSILRRGASGVSLGLSVLALASANPAAAQQQSWDNTRLAKRPYVFAQQHNVNGRPDAEGRVQRIRLGWPLQVQLPGNPAVWTFAPQDSPLIEPRGRTMVYSPNRIGDTQSIFVFDFVLSSDAKPGDTGAITLTTQELPQSLGRVVPTGIFVVEFSVIDPS